MKIFSSHRRKLEPHRRFGTSEFKDKIKKAQNYKRTYDAGKFHRYRYLIYASAALVIYFLFISSYFRITEITIAGNQQVSSDQVSTAIKNNIDSRVFLVPQNNYFLVNKGRIEKILQKELPIIKEITKFDRKGHNGLVVEIKERQQGFALKNKEVYFLVDDEGVIVKEMDKPVDLLTVVNQADEDLKIGDALPPKLTAYILSMQKAWGNKITTPIVEVRIPARASTDAIFASQEGWSAFFDINRSMQVQLNSLALLLSKQVPAGSRGRLAYIDLRIEKVAYICYKDAPCFERPQVDESTQIKPEAQ